MHDVNYTKLDICLITSLTHIRAVSYTLTLKVPTLLHDSIGKNSFTQPKMVVTFCTIFNMVQQSVFLFSKIFCSYRCSSSTYRMDHQ